VSQVIVNDVKDVTSVKEVKKLKKKKGITIKIPRSQLESNDVDEKIKGHLRNNPENAYTIGGLMVEVFGANAEDLNAPFKDWPKGMPSLYTKIRHVLEKLKADGTIDSKKRGKGYFYFWCEDH
jgi:hypothetical protein